MFITFRAQHDIFTLRVYVYFITHRVYEIFVMALRARLQPLKTFQVPLRLPKPSGPHSRAFFLATPSYACLRAI